MSINTPNPLLQPLLRMMLLPPASVRFAPLTAQKTLRTVLIRETPLATGNAATFDDSCRVTVVEGDLDKLANVKLTVTGGARVVTGLQLAILTTAGHLQLTVSGDNVRVFLGAGVVMRATVQLAGQATLFVGDGSTFAHARIIGANADITFGDDCQILDDVVFQCSDPHPVTDLDAGEVLNAHRRHLKVGRHVLIGRRALVLPDTRLGDGCVVEPGAVVSGEVAAQAQVGGAPACVIRPRVGWARHFGQQPPVLETD